MRLPFSIFSLVIFNFVPIFGIIYLNWNVGEVIILYWLETIIIGVLNVFKMSLAQGESKLTHLSRIWSILFFILHYGFFNYGHGIFIFIITKSYFKNNLIDILIYGGIGLLISHLISFLYNYLLQGEYKKATVYKLMIQPYQRIGITHLTIIFGFFLTNLFKSNLVLPLVLVIIKIIFDLYQHIQERLKFQSGRYDNLMQLNLKLRSVNPENTK